MLPAGAVESFSETVPKQMHDVTTLVVDDSEFDRLRIRRLVRTAGLKNHVDEVESLSKMRAALDQQKFDVIILDYNLTEGTGIEALNFLKDHPTNSDAATIMIAGNERSEIAVQAVKLGCSDYIPKDRLSVDRLKSAISRAVNEAYLGLADETTRTDSLEAVTTQIMTSYASIVRPEMARIVRELRRLKSSDEVKQAKIAADLEQVEERCIRLWQNLVVSERPDPVVLYQ